MLRSLSMHNFVHFTQPQRMIFKPGVNFIIGPNSSGKTAIFEMIRRCMSNEINTTTSSIPDKKIIAYTVCEFQFLPEIESQHPIKGTVLKSFPSVVFSCVFVEPIEASPERSNYYKVFCALCDGVLEIYILQYHEVSYDCYVNDLNNENARFSQIKPVPIEDELYKSFESIILSNSLSIHDTIHKLFEQIQSRISVQLNDVSITNTFTWLKFVGLFPMRFLGHLQRTRSITLKSITNSFTWLKNTFVGLFRMRSLGLLTQTRSITLKSITNTFTWLTDNYVGLFPMRSLGPLQWTRSITPKSEEEKEKDYKKACEKAQILMTLLSDEKKDSIEWELENVFHNHLVYPYKFVKEKESIIVYNEELTEQTKTPLLKVPDGIVEAKQLSLLLSEKQISTLTLEEPDRGMHPQMIKKMRDWVLKLVKDKTLLVISHHPAIIDHYTLDRVHLCSKKGEKGELSHVIQKIPDIDSYRKYGMVEEMKSLLFSERVLFVEGYTDQIYMEAIFDIMINNPGKLFEVIIRGINSDQIEVFQKYLSSFQIVQLIEGCGAGPKKMKFCNKINKECHIVYDFDAMIKDKKIDGEKIEVNFKTNKNKADFKKSPDEISRFEIACDETKVFVWIEGALEDVINAALPGKQSTKEKRSKKEVIYKSNEEIYKTAETLIPSNEGKRFVNFLYRMMMKREARIAEKRKQQEPLRKQPKRKKQSAKKDLSSKRKEETSKVSDSSSSETDSSNILQDQRTELSQDLMDMNAH